MNIYLVRHGQSQGNIQGIIQGQSDYPLTDLGRKQAQLLGEHFKKLDVDALYSSDLARAIDTATFIGKNQGLSITALEIVQEIGLGPLEGKKRAEILESYPALKTGSILLSGIEGTETVESITERCASLKSQLLKNHDTENVAIVSHGGFISIFLMYLLIGEKWSENYGRPFLIDNTGITKIHMTEDKSTILYTNRLTHLE